MTGLPLCPPFDEFYEVLWGREPFPWQSRLARRAATGNWPDAVAAPTGCGKTACIEIAVWALAYQAHLAPSERTAPTRLWWVVNRRALVDDTYAHAMRIAEMLDRPDSGPIRCVARRLRHLAVASPAAANDLEALEALRLRAGDSRNRPRNMAAPAVICATVPMFGSRLLFRGHGAGRFTWPIDAALAGVDSLVILDEAHVSAPLVQLVEQIRRRPPPDEALLPRGRGCPQLVSVSATVNAQEGRDIITIDDTDRTNPVIAQRLNAPKRLSTLRTTQPIAEAVHAQVSSEVGSFSKAIVYVNTPMTARAVADELRRSIDGIKVIVATGRLRGVEARVAAQEISHRIGGGASPPTPTVVVATQTLEVGADLDADLLVTESCGAAALVQRLGRLNRFGQHADAPAVLIHPVRQQPIDGLYPDAPAVFERLEEAADSSGAVEAGPERIRGHLAGLLDPAESDGEAPALSEPLLHEWIKTTTPPPGEAPVEAFYAGFRPAASTAELLWRAHIPESGEPLWPPVSSQETVAVSLTDARRLIIDNPDHTALLANDAHSVDTSRVESVTPGALVIAHTSVGCLDPDGHWDLDSASPVPDMSVLSWGLPLTRVALEALLGDMTSVAEQALAALEAHDNDETRINRTAAALTVELAESPPPALYTRVANWSHFASALAVAAESRLRTAHPVVVQPRTGAPRIPLRSPGAVVDASDGLSFLQGRSSLSTLDAHSSDTACRAAAAAEALGLHERLTRIVELAARFHDLGKSDPRFQRWLTPLWSPGDTMMAKSHMPRWRLGHARRDAGYPQRGRHEEHSRRLVGAWLRHADHQLSDEEADLLLHLVAAHHGRARPLLLGVPDHVPPSTRVQCDVDGVSVTIPASLNETDWDQPARFARLNRRYGPWGLAALETLVRQADWQSSQSSETRALDVR